MGHQEALVDELLPCFEGGHIVVMVTADYGLFDRSWSPYQGQCGHVLYQNCSTRKIYSIINMETLRLHLADALPSIQSLSLSLSPSLTLSHSHSTPAPVIHTL